MVDVVIVACMMHKAFSHSFMAAIYKMCFADEDDIDSFKAYHTTPTTVTIITTPLLLLIYRRPHRKHAVKKKKKFINHFHFYFQFFFVFVFRDTDF